MPRPPASPQPRRRACWLLAAAAAAASLAASPTHAYQPCPADAIDENSHPQVQCNRDPPCVRFTYLSKEKCRGELRLDSGWPTYDAHVPREAGWATAADLLAVHARNKTVLIVGDSVTHGWYASFLCECLRAGLTLSEEKDHPRLRALAHAVSATQGWDRVPVEEVFVEETGSVIAYKGYGRPTLSDTAALTSVADVLLINYGAHYHVLEEYEADMGPLFESLGDFNRQPCKVSIFRETSMQAFDETGVWEPGSDKTTSRCSATPPAVAASNRIALQNGVVARLGREQRVPILPYYNASLARWDSYEEKYCEIVQRLSGNTAPCTDCSHFCVSPTLTAKMVDDWHNILNAAGHIQSGDLCAVMK